MPIFLLSLLVFLTPFIINPFFGYFFEPPKVIFAEILIEALLFIFLFRKSFFHSLEKHQLILSAALVGLTLIHLVLSPSSLAFFGNEFRLQGVFLLWHLLALFLISSRLHIAELPKELFPLSLFFLLFSALIVAPDLNGRAVGTLGEANALASSAIFFFPFAFIFKHKSGNKIFILSVFIITLVTILLSGSRSGMLAFLIQIFFIAANKLIGFKKALTLAGLAIVLSMALPFIEGGGWFENRAEIWQTALYSGSQTILGHGFGNIEQALTSTSEILGNNIRFQSVDSAHNILLDFWVQGGIIGFSVFLLLIILSLRGLIRMNRTEKLTVFLGLITVLLFNPASVATLVAFWFILGQGFRHFQSEV